MELDCGLCRVRSWQPGDAASLTHHANNRAIWLNLRDAFPHPYTPADARQWLDYVVGQQPETNWAIDRTGEAVGGIGLVLHTDVERISAEVGYWLGEPYWGQGLVTAALQTLTPWALAQFSLTRIYALPFARNVASARVLEKAGYVREGTLRRSAIKAGEVLDQWLYAYVQT